MKYALINLSNNKIIQQFNVIPSTLYWSGSDLITSGPTPGMKHINEVFAILEIVEMRPTIFHEETGYTGIYYPETKTFVKKVSYIFNKRDLENAKIQARQLINEWKASKQNKGFEFEGLWFQSDPDSRIAIQSAVMNALSFKDYKVNWIAHDNSKILMDTKKILDFGRTLDGHLQHWHDLAQSLKVKIDKAEEVEEIQKILDSRKDLE